MEVVEATRLSESPSSCFNTKKFVLNPAFTSHVLNPSSSAQSLVASYSLFTVPSLLESIDLKMSFNLGLGFLFHSRRLFEV